MDRLLDPDDYRSPQDSGKELKVGSKRQRRYGPAEGSSPVGEGWFIITTATNGQLDKVHLIAATLDNGSVLTRCNQTGRVVVPVSVGQLAHLCPTCEGCEP